jgi:hypothetical protein
MMQTFSYHFLRSNVIVLMSYDKEIFYVLLYHLLLSLSLVLVAI